MHGLTLERGHNQAALAPRTGRPPVPIPRQQVPPPVAVAAHDGAFPDRLRAMAPPVRRLWYRGRLPRTGAASLAIVGARAATVSGCRAAARLAGAVARAGYEVVSGGALGIDAAAHLGALESGGITFAVLGCGVDVVYPDRHEALFDQIAASGGLLSEHGPGTPPRSRQFPSRNRIVAALADAVLVVEAQVASGALITARLARRAGRPVFAVPGTPGADGLIGAGHARAVAKEAQLFQALRGEPQPAVVPPERYRALLSTLRGGPLRPAELALKLGRDLPDTLALITEAALEGWISRLPGGAIASIEG